MSKMFFMPLRPAFDSAGIVVPGAQFYFTLTGTNTPSAPYTDAALTTHHENPIIADGIGYLPPVYLDDAITYRVRVYDENAEVGVDVPLEEYDPYVPALANTDILADLAGSSGYLLIGGLRGKLTADQTYYVSPTGSDANNGLTSGAAFATIQKAINTAYGLDLNGHEVTISVADGTYVEALTISGPLVGVANSDAEPLKIVAQNAGLAIVSPSSGSCLNIASRAYVFLDGLKWQTGGGHGWLVSTYSTVIHRNCVFGSCSGNMLVVQEHAYVKAIGPTTVSGNADTFCHCTVRSRVSFTDQTINFTGSPNTFGTYLWGINDGTVALDGATLTGTRPTGGTTVHDLGFLNAYSLVNAAGWGFLGVGTYTVQDASIVACDPYTGRTCYVRSDATSDQNDGGENTVGRAFKTIQGAMNFLATFPFNAANAPAGAGVKIKVADGTYAETVSLRNVPYFDGTIEGNLVTPANVNIAGAADGVVGLGVRTNWNINGVKIAASAGSCIRSESGTNITISSDEFGSASSAHISCTGGGRVTALGNYTVTSSAAMHFQVLDGGKINVSGRTISMSGANNFTSGTVRVWGAGSEVNIEGATFTASPVPTAVKYDIRANGVIWTNGSGVTLPGSSAGTTATGGQYA